MRYSEVKQILNSMTPLMRCYIRMAYREGILYGIMNSNKKLKNQYKKWKQSNK